MADHVAARQDIIAAYTSMYGVPPSLREAQAFQTVGYGESGYGTWWKGNSCDGGRGDGKGSNNWGAVQAPHGPPCGADSFIHADRHADGKWYCWCYKRYPTPAAGAADVIANLTKFHPKVWEAIKTGSIDDVAYAMHDAGYYELDPAQYAAGMRANLATITKALGEPIALTSPLLPTKLPGYWWLYGAAAAIGLVTAVAQVYGHRKVA